MRPLRLLLTFCFFGLTVLFTLLSIFAADPQEGRDSSAPGEKRAFRGLFSFYGPTNLFPPAAIISLTDDNSTFFLARPAVFGPSLPSDGLSGQLWIGSGFGDESYIRTSATSKAEGELGCSDIPGWVEGQGVWFDDQELGYVPGQETDRISARSEQDNAFPYPSQQPPSDDGTDEYLHYPLSSSPGLQLKSSLSYGDKSGRVGEHADIQSLQEGAEIAGKVVLLSRGGCGFLEKVKWAQRRGGVAVIVGDNVRGGPLINMWTHGDTSNITIPSLFTSHTTAHLLSSLVPPGMRGIPLNESQTDFPEDNTKSGERVKSGYTKSNNGVKTSSAARNSPTPDAPSIGDEATEQNGWTGALLSSVGISKDRSEKQKDWIVSEDWDDEPKTNDKSKSSRKPEKTVEDDFVIGVHDWRDPDIVNVKDETSSLATRTSATTAQNSPTRAAKAMAGSKKPTLNNLSGGSITPGSGEYDESRDMQSKGWFNSILKRSENSNSDKSQAGPKYIKDIALDDSTFGAPNSHRGLWVTMTPTAVSTSPFFDTLLVLVVSPLITLTVVYTMLIVRSRIRRRRWRAPKSLVERLPVHTYRTMSCSSSATSTLPGMSSSPPPSAARTRPRSRTESVLGQPVSALYTANSEEKTPLLRKKYSGRQVECVVCLEEYIDGQSRVMSLPCGHEFHAECITPWLTTRRRTCPICKGDVVRSMTGADSDSSSSSPAGGTAFSPNDIQAQAAMSINTSPSAAIPISRGASGNDDLERGEDMAATLVNDDEPSMLSPSGLRAAISRSLSMISGEAAWTRAQEERNR